MTRSYSVNESNSWNNYVILTEFFRNRPWISRFLEFLIQIAPIFNGLGLFFAEFHSFYQNNNISQNSSYISPDLLLFNPDFYLKSIIVSSGVAFPKKWGGKNNFKSIRGSLFFFLPQKITITPCPRPAPGLSPGCPGLSWSVCQERKNYCMLWKWKPNDVYHFKDKIRQII